MLIDVTYHEFKRQLGKAGLSVKNFAELIKQTPASVSNHAAHEKVPQHLAIIAALMAHMADNELDFRAPLNRICFDAAKPRGSPIKGKFGAVKQAGKHSALIDIKPETERP